LRWQGLEIQKIVKPQKLNRMTKDENLQVNHAIAKPVLAAVVSMLVTQDDFWKDVCNKVVGDALFEQKSITDTVEYLKSKYKIELLSVNGG